MFLLFSFLAIRIFRSDFMTRRRLETIVNSTKKFLTSWSLKKGILTSLCAAAATVSGYGVYSLLDNPYLDDGKLVLTSISSLDASSQQVFKELNALVPYTTHESEALWAGSWPDPQNVDERNDRIYHNGEIEKLASWYLMFFDEDDTDEQDAFKSLCVAAYEKYNMCKPYRYPRSFLEELVDEDFDSDKPFALQFVARSDYNHAWGYEDYGNSWGGSSSEFYTDLRDTYNVVVYEVSSDEDIVRFTKKFYDRHGLINFCMISGHGDQDSQTLGFESGETYDLDYSDALQFMLHDLSSCFSDDALLFLDGCSVAKGGFHEKNLSRVMAAALNVEVVGVGEVTRSHDTVVSFDDRDYRPKTFIHDGNPAMTFHFSPSSHIVSLERAALLEQYHKHTAQVSAK